MSEKLDLLIRDELLGPARRAISHLGEIGEQIETPGLRPITLAGLYVLAVSRLEIALSESAVYVLSRNPWQMEFDAIDPKRHEILAAELVRELLDAHAERVVRKWSYGPKPRFFKNVLKAVDLPMAKLIDHAPLFTQLTDRRNTIVHGGRTLADEKETTKTWPSQAEVRDGVASSTTILQNICEAIGKRYETHTRVAALRRLWSHLFDSPLMKFDDYWIVDTEDDTVPAMKPNPAIDMLSRSERILLGLWRAEFAGDASLLRDFSMKSLDRRRRRDLVTLIAALRDIWLY
jgi:hypothetical protein